MLALWQYGGRWQAVASGGGSAHDRTPLVWRRGAWGRLVARWTLGANQVSRVRDSGWLLPLSALICGPDGGKTPRNGVEKATFGGICYVGHNGATPFGDYIYV